MIKRISDPAKANMTSFHGTVLDATPEKLHNLFGPTHYGNNDGQDKVNMEWQLELEDGTPFTIYDWKEYRKLSMTKKVEWHIGAHSEDDSNRAFLEILKMI